MYYMGFILTLLSLFITLTFQTSIFADPYSIFNYMGVAMSTTIFGMIVRIVLIQFRRTVSDVEEEASDEIQNLAAELREEIRMTATSFKQLAVQINGSARESAEKFRALAHEMDGALREGAAGFRALLEEEFLRERQALEESIRESTTSFAEAVKALKQAMEAGDIDKTIKNTAMIILSKSLEVLSNYKKALDENAGQVLDAFKDMTASIKQTAKGISISDARITKARESMEELHALYGAAISKFSDKIDGIDVSAHLTPPLEGIRVSIETFNQRLITVLNGAAQNLDALLESIQRRRKTADGVLSELDTVTTLIDTISNFKLCIANCGTALQSLSGRIQDLDGKALALPSSLTQIVSEIDKIEKDVVASTDGFSKKVSETIGAINTDSTEIMRVGNALKSTLLESVDFIKTKVREN
jgi:methyl-accepting chemotaxis protein